MKFRLDTFARIIRHASPRQVSRIRFFAEEGDAGGEAGGEADFEAMPIPSERYVDNPNISKYKTVGDLVKGHSEVVKLVGSKGVLLPGENAKPEDMDRFYNSLGRPEKPEGYKFSQLEKLHPEIKMTPETESEFRNLAHRNGLTAKQADGLFKDYFTNVSSQLARRDEATSKAKHEAERELRTAWGPDYDKNISGAKRIVEKFGGSNATEAFGDLGNNPKVLKTLANIAKQFSEDGFIKGDAVTNSEKNESKKRITDIMLNKDHPYWKQGPGHAEAVEEMKRLQSIVHPEVEV